MARAKRIQYTDCRRKGGASTSRAPVRCPPLEGHEYANWTTSPECQQTFHIIHRRELTANSASLIIIQYGKKWEKLDVNGTTATEACIFRELEEVWALQFPNLHKRTVGGKRFLRILQADDKNKIPYDTEDQCDEFSVLVKWFISETPSKA